MPESEKKPNKIRTDMIENIDPLEIFKLNLTRTNMLINAVEKIRGYNHLYQSNAYEKNLDFGKTVEEIQQKELLKIESTCSEQAIISLASLWEAYLKTLVAHLLSSHPNYFMLKKTKHESEIVSLIKSTRKFSILDIENKINLKNRFDYYKFFNGYDIPLLTPEEKNLLEYIFILRNSFIHSSGTHDVKTKRLLNNFNRPIGNLYISTQSKQLRTKIKRLIPKINDRIIRKTSAIRT